MAANQDSIQFLTLDEAQQIDRTTLSPMEKFMARITVSALRIIIKIAEDLQVHGEELTPEQIVQWIEKDSVKRKELGEDAAFLKWDSSQPDLDFEDDRQDQVTSANLSGHEKFLTRMVISAMQTLQAIAKECSSHIEYLSVEQIINSSA
ncbi:MAG: hypothetical protein AUK48_14700 [Oscillatoriales cyanobacterium CG2_30_44_21]|nr:MAG: hypothetical protein AUK48_14700 [Oscillatoriales cyanobacterium CG2_30_44_21]